MKTMKNSRSQPVPGPGGRGGRAHHWDREKEAGLDEDPLQRRVYVGGKWANTWNYLQFCNSSHYIMNDNNIKC